MAPAEQAGDESEALRPATWPDHDLRGAQPAVRVGRSTEVTEGPRRNRAGAFGVPGPVRGATGARGAGPQQARERRRPGNAAGPGTPQAPGTSSVPGPCGRCVSPS
ncbi:hypothetical protein GCM10009663_59840 [Kitasatospora arboriphila]|uniref:Uncharacterized protein n=1 Tax=Kitasatospora arboriphila TaxID=258052 RepID=A0ABP4EL53_9ACTN